MRGTGHAYLVRADRGWVAFVPPKRGGSFVLTDWCVLVAPCSDCRARVGELCSGKHGETSATHVARRRRSRELKRKPETRELLARACPGVAFALDALEELERSVEA